MDPSPVIIDEEDRYSRLKLIGWWDQTRLKQAKILVVGAGALGNEVLKNLALVGIGHITLIDFDTIENSNLSRSVLFRASDTGQPKAEVAARMLAEINPDVIVDTIQGNVLTEIGLGLVKEMDLVIGCLDNREARLWVNRMCWKVNTPWIDGGIQEINGVAKVFLPPNGACYECGMTEMDYQLIQLRYSCPLLKREDLQQGKVPTAPTIASMIGAMQVQEALKLLHNIPVDGGTALVFNGVANHFYKSKFQHREDCLSHETWLPVVKCSLDNQASLREVFDLLPELVNSQESAASNPMEPHEINHLVLDRDLVTALECGNCQSSRQVMLPRPLVSMSDSMCESCNEPMTPHMVHLVDVDSPLAEMKLSQIGVPDRDILQLTGDNEVVFVELAAHQTDS